MNTSQGTLGALSPAAGQFPANHAYYLREFLETVNPELIYKNFGTTKAFDKNSGNRMVINQVLKLPTDAPTGGGTFLLTEGVTPTAQQFQMRRFEHTVNQYGGFAITTDRLTMESVNGITSEFNKRIAEQAGEVMNMVIRDDLLGGDQVRLAGGAAYGGVGVEYDALTAATAQATICADLDFLFRAFKHEKAKAFTPQTKGSTNVGTAPQFESYPIIVPIDAIGVLESLNDGVHKFIHAKDYSSQRALWPNEIGSFKQFAFILDSEASIITNGAGTPQSVALCPVFAKGAYLVTPMGADSAEIIVKALGSSGSTDPLNQRASIGWKAMNGAFIVQQTYMFRYAFSLGAA